MDALAMFQQKMHEESMPTVVVDTFKHYYSQLSQGETGLIAEQCIEPVQEQDIPDVRALQDYSSEGHQALQHTAVIKLNGGLGTSMGLNKAKSLLVVKDDLSFLDITACAIQKLGEKCGSSIPLVLMNSFNTDTDTMQALGDYIDLDVQRFLQHKFPKVLQKTLTPADYPQNRQLEWNPPGHGDVYTALVTSGMLEQLLTANIQYAFISNIDNLSAMVDENILGYFAHHQLPFMMEVTERTEMDKKGGHLAKLKNGKFVLRESAQCPEEDMDNFQDIHRYRYFNTNNIWVHLPTLQRLLQERNNVLGLPMIRNSKYLNPRDKTSAQVYQVETAMGAAICLFDKATAICVPRTRFAPVKKCDDLLVLRSDYYTLDRNYQLLRNSQYPIVVELATSHYGHIDQFEKRFAHGVPSLKHCRSLIIDADVSFGKNVVIKGAVEMHQDVQIADNATIVVVPNA